MYLCLSRSSNRVPRRVRGRDMTWWLWRTGLYDAQIDALPADKQKLKRRSPNPMQAPARDLRLRELARDHSLRYVGHAMGLSADGAALLVDGPTVGETMERCA